MLNVIWTLKVCMLYMFSRLTMGTHQRRAMKYLAIYVGVGYLAVELAFFIACRPFNGYWAVPPPDPQCTTLQHYAIIQACFNLSSDVAMLLVPLPMAINLKLPLNQKIILSIVFSIGIFAVSLYPQVSCHWRILISKITILLMTLTRSLRLSSPKFTTSRTFTTRPTCSGTRVRPLLQSMFQICP